MTAMRHRGGAGAPAWMRSWRRGDAGMDGAAGRPRERAVRGPPAWPACTPSDTQRRLYGRCPDRLPAIGATLLARTVQCGDARCSDRTTTAAMAAGCPPTHRTASSRPALSTAAVRARRAVPRPLHFRTWTRALAFAPPHRHRPGDALPLPAATWLQVRRRAARHGRAASVRRGAAPAHPDTRP